MNSNTFAAFGDELTKIAFFQKLRSGFVNALKEGWHGTPESPSTWMGEGMKTHPGMSYPGKAWQQFSSLGGLTKALPVGAKSLMLLGTGLMARDALKPVDPTGRERSRTERLTGLAGNTVGGLVGSAVGNRIAPGFMGTIGGGIIGGMAGEKLVAAPFAAHRAGLQQRAAQAQQMQPQYPPTQGVPA